MELEKVRAIKRDELIDYVRREWDRNDFISIRFSRGGEHGEFDAAFSIAAEYIQECVDEYDEDELMECAI